MPRSIFTSDSRVISIPRSCISLTMSTCLIFFSFLIRLIFSPINIKSYLIFCSSIINTSQKEPKLALFYLIIYLSCIIMGLILVHFKKGGISFWTAKMIGEFLSQHLKLKSQHDSINLYYF